MNAIRTACITLTVVVGIALTNQAQAFDLFGLLDAPDVDTTGSLLAISNEPTYLGNPLTISNEPVYKGNPLTISNEPVYKNTPRLSGTTSIIRR
ncbi:hypothetical protein G3N56_02225 [Desulfovibrio sulfodismutans]|uniref:Uncharacterized protein n=1 Tax=Desulfolutivibrio sulfodismutans TaxID=63561 RepID=A0A7K3NHA2_9BACT|nr:hypothetical protein [Desulfolutivibrio sulfodismutans]NDY55562.1 hypothetical protein [Desulfolutivibrio sulfodismutans]QLA11464.1 hypothetical protein GD606_03820 [Desulfolutivibrio sulfodismutans DSM 3696]